MKHRSLLIAGIGAAAAAAWYIVRRLKTKEQPQPQKRSHHLTNVFSKAKAVALQH